MADEIKYSLDEFVLKAIGPVRPVADASIDPQRGENLEQLTFVVLGLYMEIVNAAKENRSPYGSAAKVGAAARTFLVTLRDDLEANLEHNIDRPEQRPPLLDAHLKEVLERSLYAVSDLTQGFDGNPNGRHPNAKKLISDIRSILGL